jgi:Zn-finger nucleic acid-binding protein
MRFLVACPECRRQFDATGRPVGSTFQCSCGAAVAVPAPHAHDAAVIRCSSCGAPREGTARACRFCASEFTLHERDLDTICPGCMARVSGRARFCHHCGTPVLTTQAAVGESAYRCPSCAERRALASRRLGQANVALFECSACGGLWIEKEIFEVMADRARSGKLPEGFGGGEPAAAEPAPGPAGQRLQYRPCVTCGALMNRQNYGRKSGVILDVCARHGLWFDLHELDRLLRWIRQGGETRAGNLQLEQERTEARQKALAAGLQPWNQVETEGSLFSPGWRSSLLGDLLSGLFPGGLRRFFH